MTTNSAPTGAPLEWFDTRADAAIREIELTKQLKPRYDRLYNSTPVRVIKEPKMRKQPEAPAIAHIWSTPNDENYSETNHQEPSR